MENGDNLSHKRRYISSCIAQLYKLTYTIVNLYRLHRKILPVKSYSRLATLMFNYAEERDTFFISLASK